MLEYEAMCLMLFAMATLIVSTVIRHYLEAEELMVLHIILFLLSFILILQYGTGQVGTYNPATGAWVVESPANYMWLVCVAIAIGHLIYMTLYGIAVIEDYTSFKIIRGGEKDARN